MLASDARLALALAGLGDVCGGEADVWGDGLDMAAAPAGQPLVCTPKQGCFDADSTNSRLRRQARGSRGLNAVW